MNIEIQSITGAVLFSGDFPDLKSAVEAAVAQRASLNRASLDGASLNCASLNCANLARANLARANLASANLARAYLARANLARAYLARAYLARANLASAYLAGADFTSANLASAYLAGADLTGADFTGADLAGADLAGADFTGAKGAELAIARTRILPAEGNLVGWKKCADGVLVKLLIPTDARRSHAFGRKCRAEFVRVLEVIGAKEARSGYNSAVVYRPGVIVHCDKWCEDYTQECAGGIHFFITREEAEAYDL
jgi:hypothetical protein